MSRCRNGHNLTLLGRDKGGHCYACRRNRDRMRAQEPERKTKMRQATARWTTRNIERVRSYQQEWNRQNPEKMKDYQRAYYYRNQEARKANTTQWLKKHPDARRTYNARVRSAHYRPTAPLPPAIIESILAYYGRQCVYCGGDFQELDHLVPLSRGGEHCVDNIAPACQSCNRSKGARPIWVMLGAA